MRLYRLQRDFSEALRSECEFARAIGPRIEIYRNNYRAQLRAALADTYKHLQLWLGDSEFLLAADAHIDRSQPRSWTLDHYGRDFPLTLARLYPGDAEVPELAWLDLAMAEAFVAADAPSLTSEGLSAVDWEKARIRFTPSVRLSEATTNAAAIWSALESDVVPPAAIRLAEKGGYLVWRRLLASQFRLMDVRDYRAVAALHLGTTFAEACNFYSEQLEEPQAAAAAGQLLRFLVDGDLIAAIY